MNLKTNKSKRKGLLKRNFNINENFIKTSLISSRKQLIIYNFKT